MRRFAVWVCLALASPALAQDAGLPLDLEVTQRGVITGTSVYLRMKADENSDFILMFGGNNEVLIRGRSGAWVQVQYRDEVGFVHGDYVRELPPRPLKPQSPSSGLLDLPAEIARDLEIVRDPARFTAQNATALMTESFDALDGLEPALLDYAAIDRDPAGLLRSLFELVLAIDDRMAAFHARGEYDHAMANAKRKAMRGLRFLREQVAMRTQATAPERLYGGRVPALAKQSFLKGYHWAVNPAFDVPLDADSFPRTFFVMNVGTSTVSAAIARSTSVDTMFSHFTVGYVSDREHIIEDVLYPPRTVFTIEAHIEIGVLIKPVEDHFKSSSREVIFFLRDRAQQPAVDAAADKFFERVKQAQNDGSHLGYDFSMGHKAAGLAQAVDPGQTSTAPASASSVATGKPAKRGLIDLNNYFCSGVADAIGDEAGVELFTHRSLLEQGTNSRALFVSWGIDPAHRVPAPGDGDVSAAFVRVAEGSRLDSMVDSHLMHVVLKSMFEWMDREGYELRTPLWFKPLSFVAGTFNSDRFNIGFVPRGIDTSIMRSFTAVHKAATGYFERLEAENNDYRAGHGRDMSPTEMATRLREVRDEVDVKGWFRK